jgi:copper(I)-binding protein
MTKRILVVATILLWLALGQTGASWASTQPSSTFIALDITGATLTTANAGGDSALSVILRNTSSQTLYMTGIGSSIARSSMIFYDSNMCQGDSAMIPLQNIAISSGATQKLGYKYQGAMLGALTTKLKLGGSAPMQLSVKDSKNHLSTFTFKAKIVDAPKGLHFAMSGMH